VAQEIVRVQPLPKLLHSLRAAAVPDQLAEGLGPGLADQVLMCHRVVQTTAQGARGGAVEIGQQGVLPRIPQAGAGGADVGHGQQIEVVKALLGTHTMGEFADHVGVADVLALRGGGHDEVVFHQPFHQLGVVFAHAVLAAEGHRVGGAEQGVITAAALADVMEETSQG